MSVWSSVFLRLALLVTLAALTGFHAAFIIFMTPLAGPTPFLFFATIFCFFASLGSFVHVGWRRRTKLWVTVFFIAMSSACQQGWHTVEFDVNAVVAKARESPASAALVTGSTRGIGLEVLKTMVEQGWPVFVHGRDASTMATVAQSLNTRGPGRVIALPVGCDMTSFSDVRRFTQALIAKLKEEKLLLAVVINNAGMGSQGTGPNTEEGFERIVHANFLSPELMQHLLLPELHRHPSRGTIVHVASAAHYQAPWLASRNLAWNESSGIDLYARSKLLQITSAHTLGTMTPPLAGRIVSVHPGACATDMAEVGPRMHYEQWIVPPMRSIMGPLIPELVRKAWFEVSYCAHNVLYAAFAPNIPNGAYIQHFRVADRQLIEFPLQATFQDFRERVLEQTKQVIEEAF